MSTTTTARPYAVRVTFGDAPAITVATFDKWQDAEAHAQALANLYADDARTLVSLSFPT